MFSFPPGPHSASTLGPSCLQISLAYPAHSKFPSCRKTDVKVLKVLKGVLGVSCSTYFLRDFFLEESAWVGCFSSVYFCESLNLSLGSSPVKSVSSVTAKPRSALPMRCTSVGMDTQRLLKDNANAQVATYKCHCWDKKLEVQEVTTVVCAVWVFSRFDQTDHRSTKQAGVINL